MQAQGRADFSNPEGWPKEVVFAPRYEAADPRYVFLNRVQAIAKGTIDATLKLTAEVFAVR